MGWAGKRNFQALPLTLAKVVPSGLTPPFIQRRIIPFKAKGTEERNRLKGSPPPAAVPQAGPSPRQAGQQGGSAGPLPAAASGGRLAATGRGSGGGRGGWAQRRRRVPRSPPGSAFPARTRSLQPKVYAPPPLLRLHWPRPSLSHFQLPRTTCHWLQKLGLLSVPQSLLSLPLLLSISASEGFPGKRF